MKLLTNKNFVTKTNNWYAPIRELKEKYSSIIHAQFMNTTSSAGDWSGFIIQKVGKDSAVAIAFWQENNYPNAGFTLYTADEPFYSGNPKKIPFYENVESLWQQRCG